MLLSTWVGLFIGIVFYALMPLVFPAMRRCIDHSPILRWMEMRNRYFRNLGDPFHLGQSLLYRKRGLAPEVYSHYTGGGGGGGGDNTKGGNLLSRYLAIPDDSFLEEEEKNLICMRLSLAVWMKQWEVKSMAQGFYSMRTQARDVLQSLALTEEEDLYASIGSSITNKLEKDENGDEGGEGEEEGDEGEITVVPMTTRNGKLVIEKRAEQNVVELYKFISEVVHPDSDII